MMRNKIYFKMNKKNFLSANKKRDRSTSTLVKVLMEIVNKFQVCEQQLYHRLPSKWHDKKFITRGNCYSPQVAWHNMDGRGWTVDDAKPKRWYTLIALESFVIFFNYFTRAVLRCCSYRMG